MTAIAIGLICAVTVSLPELILRKVELDKAGYVMALALLAALAQRTYFKRFPTTNRVYDGMADFFIHIHSRYAQESPYKWIWRGCVSFFLNLFGAGVGIEGAAAEFSHGTAVAMRTRSERWSEQKRRTDVASAIAGALSAAFQAPFAAIIFCFEVGTGGRALSAIVSSISAYIGTLFLARKLGLETEWIAFFRAAPVGEYEWLKMGAIAVAGGLSSWGVIRFIRYYQENLVDLFKHQVWVRTIAGGAILVVVQLLYPLGHGTPMVEITSLLMDTSRAPAQLMIYLICKLLVLATVLASFGTVGIFWPLFMIGGVVGQAVIGGTIGLFIGAAAVWAGVLGAPIAASALILEMTGSWKLMFAGLMTGVVANQIRIWLKQKALVHRDLESRGLALLDGRSANVLSSIMVADAMNTDHQTIFENELVGDLTDKFLNSKHPFLPVINRAGSYVGLLTLDLIQEGLEGEARHSKFFEVKDLLYKSKSKAQTVRASDTLAKTAGIFEDHPCVAVLGDAKQVLGLLFAYSVRAAYDREVARRALTANRSKA